MSSLISVYTIHCIYSSCLLLCIVSTFYASHFWRKMLRKLSVYTIQPPTGHVGITFQPSRPHSSWERCDKNILMFENWRERKTKKLRDKYAAAAWFWYTWYIHPLSTCAPSFNLLGLTVPEKSVKKILILEYKRKKKNKGTHKQQQPDSGIHHTSTHCPRVYQVSTF